MGNQHALTQAGLNRGDGVPNMQHKATAAHSRSIDPVGCNSKIMGHRRWRLSSGCHPIDIFKGQPRIRQRIECRISMELYLAHLRNSTQRSGFCCADNRNLRRAHKSTPSGSK